MCIAMGCTDTVMNPKITATVVTDKAAVPTETQIVITLKNEAQRNAYLFHHAHRIGFWEIERKINNIGFPFAWDEDGTELDSASAEEFGVQ